jgi:hypothetical protein
MKRLHKREIVKPDRPSGRKVIRSILLVEDIGKS